MLEIFDSLSKSIERLKDILKEEKTIANRDSAIQRFEFTSELSWKMMQKFLRENGIVCRSPKICLEESFKYGLIEDDKRWIEMLKDRNLTSHTYDEETAEAVYERLPGYMELFENFKQKMEKELAL